MNWALCTGVLWGSLAALAGPAVAQRLESSMETDAYVHQEMLLEDRAYTAENLLPIARDFISRFRGRPLAVLRIAPNRGALIRYDGRGIVGSTFANWAHRVRLFVQSGQEPIPTIAEVNLIDGQAVLRIRNSGKVSRVVLASRDPLFEEHRGHRFEILEINGRFEGRGADQFLSITVYARAQWPVEREAVDALAARLGGLAKDAVVWVFVRPDSCFADYSDFPFLYAFEETYTIPTEEEYERAPRLGSTYDPRPKIR